MSVVILTSLLRILLTRSLSPFVLGDVHHSHLEYTDLEDLGLYVHIPFCRSLCGFCPYCKEVYSRENAALYKESLLKEIDLVGQGHNEKKPVTSLYFGGGTPTLMIDDLSEIIERLGNYFTIQTGIGVELHPEDITKENMQKLKAAGVTMVSIGIQSFDPDCLSKLGRGGDDLSQRMKQIEAASFEVVDVDLIFAISGQTIETLRNDMDTAFALGATQVSTYPFIDFTFADNSYLPMTSKTKRRMLESLVDYSRTHNLERTSVWTFARPGTGKYSSVTRDSFLGFGVSATSLLRDSFKINTFSLAGYSQRVKDGRLPTSLTIDFTKRQRAAYYLFWSAYALRLDSVAFERIVGSPLGAVFGWELSLAKQLGLLVEQGDVYTMSDRAAHLYHFVEQVYTTAYIDQMWRISRTEAFPKKIVLR